MPLPGQLPYKSHELQAAFADLARQFDIANREFPKALDKLRAANDEVQYRTGRVRQFNDRIAQVTRAQVAVRGTGAESAYDKELTGLNADLASEQQKLTHWVEQQADAKRAHDEARDKADALNARLKAISDAA